MASHLRWPLRAKDDLTKLKPSILQPQGNGFYKMLREFGSKSFTGRASDETTALTETRNVPW